MFVAASVVFHVKFALQAQIHSAASQIQMAFVKALLQHSCRDTYDQDDGHKCACCINALLEHTAQLHTLL